MQLRLAFGVFVGGMLCGDHPCALSVYAQGVCGLCASWYGAWVFVPDGQ